MARTAVLLALSLLAAAFALPLASAQGPQTYPACVYGVLNSPCFGDHDVCSPYASLQVPICVDYPGCHHYSCLSKVATPTASVQCTAAVGVPVAVAVCDVNGKEIGPVGVCQYCLPTIVVVCTAGTEEIRCWTPSITA
jgi:hypothetical protein